MRSPEKQKELDSFSPEQRHKLTYASAYKQRWTYIKTIQWSNRYLTENEYPHTDRWEQYILRSTSIVPEHIPRSVIRFLNEKSEEWFHWIVHSVFNRSVKWRFHIHIYKEL